MGLKNWFLCQNVPHFLLKNQEHQPGIRVQFWVQKLDSAKLFNWANHRAQNLAWQSPNSGGKEPVPESSQRSKNIWNYFRSQSFSRTFCENVKIPLSSIIKKNPWCVNEREMIQQWENVPIKRVNVPFSESRATDWEVWDCQRSDLRLSEICPVI